MMLTREAVSERMKVHILTVTNWVDEGKLEAVVRQPKMLFDEAAICRMLNKAAHCTEGVRSIPSDILTAEEAAKFLKIAPKTLCAWSGDDTRQLPFWNVSKKTHRFSKLALFNWWMARKPASSRKRIRM